MISLKHAIENNSIAKFVKEHRGDPKGDTTAFNKTIKKMARTKKAVPKT